MLSLNAISRKWQTEGNVKKAHFGPDLEPLNPNSGCGNESTNIKQDYTSDSRTAQ